MNRQQGFIPISFIVYGVAALALMAALATIVYKVNHWCNAACHAQTERADAAEASIKAAQDRATAITLLWAGNVTREDANAKQRDANREAQFAPVRQAVARLPAAVARTVFPADAARVLDDAIRAGNAALAGAAGQPAEKADAAPAAAAPRTDDGADRVDVAGVTQWAVTCASMYAERVDQVLGWQDFYTNLRSAQLAEAVH